MKAKAEKSGKYENIKLKSLLNCGAKQSSQSLNFCFFFLYPGYKLILCDIAFDLEMRQRTFKPEPVYFGPGGFLKCKF